MEALGEKQWKRNDHHLVFVLPCGKQTATKKWLEVANKLGATEWNGGCLQRGKEYCTVDSSLYQIVEDRRSNAADVVVLSCFWNTIQSLFPDSAVLCESAQSENLYLQTSHYGIPTVSFMSGVDWPDLKLRQACGSLKGVEYLRGGGAFLKMESSTLVPEAPRHFLRGFERFLSRRSQSQIPKPQLREEPLEDCMLLTEVHVLSCVVM